MIRRIPALALVFACVIAWPMTAGAQEEEPSLGDVARNLRKNKAQQQAQPAAEPERAVIDNENLGQVIEDAANARPVVENKTVFSIDPSGAKLKMTSPDATCSLSFNARYSSLLVRPELIEDLPLDELVKIDGPGSIQDESLQLSVFNGTEWELREITVGLTLERKPGENVELAARARVVPAAEGVMASTVERRSDVTLLYHLKTTASAFTRAEFRERIGITPGPDEDWRWSIVEAKGIRPAGASSAPESLSEPLFGEPVPFVPTANVPAEAPAQTPLAPVVAPSSAPAARTPEAPTPQNPASGAAKHGADGTAH